MCAIVIGFPGSGCSTVTEPESLERPNILLLIGDDIGVEALSSYGIGSTPADTPNLDELATYGTVFGNVWSQPSCSPTRATIMTGRYGFRTGLGIGSGGEGVAGPLPNELPPPDGTPKEWEEYLPAIRALFQPWSIEALRERRELTAEEARRSGLNVSEFGLADAIKKLQPEYSTAAFGKWHLADVRNGWLDHPASLGFDHYSVVHGRGVKSYFSWVENLNGVPHTRQGYIADNKVRDALSWIDGQGDSPWFMWYAFHLPHSPYFVPDGKKTGDTGDNAGKFTRDLSEPHKNFDYMVEEMDKKIGELLRGLSAETRANTIVIFVGDNGTTLEAIDPPFHRDRSKATLYQGGIHVPLIVSGPRVASDARVSALVNTTDLFATIVELANGDAINAPEDSVSLVPYLKQPSLPPLRRWIYADRFFPGLGVEFGDYAIRNERYKLIGSERRKEMYDLQVDPYEANNLLDSGDLDTDAQKALESLQQQARRLHQSAGERTPGLARQH